LHRPPESTAFSITNPPHLLQFQQIRQQTTGAREHSAHRRPLRAPFKETSVSAMNKLALRIPGAVVSSNVVAMATGTER
jgi:hypothetical protein